MKVTIVLPGHHHVVAACVVHFVFHGAVEVLSAHVFFAERQGHDWTVSAFLVFLPSRPRFSPFEQQDVHLYVRVFTRNQASADEYLRMLQKIKTVVVVAVVCNDGAVHQLFLDLILVMLVHLRFGVEQIDVRFRPRCYVILLTQNRGEVFRFYFMNGDLVSFVKTVEISAAGVYPNVERRNSESNKNEDNDVD